MSHQWSRLVFWCLVVAFTVWVVLAVRVGAGEPSLSTGTTTGPDPPPEPPPVVVERTLQGRNIEQWHQIAQRYLQRNRGLIKTLRFDPETRTAIGLACIVYGHCAELWRKAECESHIYRYAKNPSGASGLFQFMPSTFAGTPFGRYSIWDPYANALAAGWMHSRGRGGAWVCQ